MNYATRNATRFQYTKKGPFFKAFFGVIPFFFIMYNFNPRTREGCDLSRDTSLLQLNVSIHTSTRDGQII